MEDFWYFAKRLGQYRRLVATGLSAALFDALCAFGGFGVLMWVVDQFFQKDAKNVHELVATKLKSLNQLATQWGAGALLGDLTALAQWVPTGRFNGLVFLLGIILVLAVIGATMRFTHQICVVTAGLRVVMGIRRDAFQRMLHAPMEQLLVAGSADQLARVVRDATELGKGFTALFARAVRDVLFGATMLLWALVVNWQLTLLFLVSGPVVYLAIRKFGKRIRKATRRALRAYGSMVGAIEESMRGLMVVKVHGAEGYERRRFNTINRKVFAQEFRARIARALSTPAIELVGIVGFMGVVLIAAWVVLSPGGPTPAEMGKVLFFLGIAGTAFKPLANLNNNLQEAAAAAGRLRQMLQLPIEAIGPGMLNTAGPSLPRHRRSVEFEQVCYHYPGNDKPAVAELDLPIEQGQTVAIVGPNGSGKSTLLSLLPRLIEPTQGRVLIDGHDIAQYSLKSVRQQMAMVTQQTVLFEGTIAENIAYGQAHASRCDVIAAAQTAMAHEFIDTLPRGYDTPLGEGGVGLSGGQRQRLAIARAVLRDPAILILDEATSQVDAESEARITEAMRSMRAGRTTFVVAHRLSTVVDADVIVVMDQGRLVAQGSHEQLLQRSDLYQELAQHQLQAARNG
jgi:ABC-type multidrug transport system fused ATPase/permease subunit